jgi:hypothetical protein
MAELKVVYEKVQQYASSADRFAGILDEGIDTADQVAAAVNGVLIGVAAVASVGAAGAAAAAVNTYYFTEVRPTANRTRDFLREFADYFRQVAANLEAADASAAQKIKAAEAALGLAEGTIGNGIEQAVSGLPSL